LNSAGGKRETKNSEGKRTKGMEKARSSVDDFPGGIDFGEGSPQRVNKGAVPPGARKKKTTEGSLGREREKTTQRKKTVLGKDHAGKGGGKNTLIDAVSGQ